MVVYFTSYWVSTTQRAARFCDGNNVPPASAAAPLIRPLLQRRHVPPASAAAPSCCPLLHRRPRAARFCNGAHVPHASATAPTCRSLLRRRPRAARFVGGALCRPLVWRRPLAARFCGGAQWKTLSPKTLSPMPFKNVMKMASWLNCKRFQTKMNSKSQKTKVSGTW